MMELVISVSLDRVCADGVGGTLARRISACSCDGGGGGGGGGECRAREPVTSEPSFAGALVRA